jgi:diguanylate cyclase (GGDEF)-like protein
MSGERRGLRLQPAVATQDRMAVTAGVFYMTGSALAIAISVIMPEPNAHPYIIRSVSVLVFILGVLVMTFQKRPAWTYQLFNVCGTLLVTLVIFLMGGGEASAVMALLYLFATLDAFFFFPWPTAVALHMFAFFAEICDVAVFHTLSLGMALGLWVLQSVTAAVVGQLVRAAGDAEIDPLTSLPNRHGLERILEQALLKAERAGTPISVVVLNLDHFKAVNAAVGNAAGDRLLRSVATHWREILPPDARLCRHGGDEFTLLLPGQAASSAVDTVESLRAVLAGLGQRCSAGVASWQVGQSAAELLNRAEVALHQAKRSGRDRICCEDLQVGAQELREAMLTGALRVVYQPTVDLRTGRPTGAEALSRWQHPTRGNVPPDEFIPVAEASDIIHEFGLFVLRAATKTAASWATTDACIAVNVSGMELLRPSYVEDVLRILAENELSPHRLILEVTETTIGADASIAITTLTRLRGHGIRVSVDDFGVGYSSLSRLDRLPVDILKLDRSFVASISPNAEHAPIVAAVAAFAAAVGLSTVSEGIEEPYQAKLVARLGFTEGQGYLFSRPCEADELPFNDPSWVYSELSGVS